MKLQGEVVCAMEATVSGILPSTPCFVLAVLAAQDVNLFIAVTRERDVQARKSRIYITSLLVLSRLLKMMSIRYLSFTYIYRAIYQVLECINCRYVELFSGFPTVPRFRFRSSFIFDCIGASVPSAEIAVCARVAPPTSISNIQSVEGREQPSPAFCGIYNTHTHTPKP